MSEALMWVLMTSFRTPEAMVRAPAASWGVTELVTFVLVANSFWNRKVSNDLHSNCRTHVKDLKNIVEIQPAGGNRLSVTLRVEPPRNYIPFAPLD